MDGPKFDQKPCPVISEQAVHELALVQCTAREIATHLKCSDEYINDHFSAIIKRGYDEGCSSLRRRMYKAAMEGNTGIMIWLSKQWLGMKDKQDEGVQIVNFNVVVNEVPE